MHWTARLEGLAIQYVRKTLSVEETEQTPPVRQYSLCIIKLLRSVDLRQWISVHIRRGDFAHWCYQVPVDDCFAPMSAFVRRVDEVKQEISQRKGIHVNHVIVTSDEKNATWWQVILNQGWYRVDSSDTVEQYGTW